MKESDIPPIRGNPRLGKETERDASVMYGGAQLPAKKHRSGVKRAARPARRSRQQSFTIHKAEALRLLSEKLGQSATAIVNLGIATLEELWFPTHRS